jgi:Membrane-associated phospholipid phosphatase
MTRIEFLKSNKYYFITILFFTIFGGVLLLLIPRDAISLWINRNYHLYLDKSILFFNEIGSLKFSLITIFFFWVLTDWKWALKAAVCFIGVMLVTQLLKHLIFPGTLRPTLYFQEDVLRLIEGVKQLETESFPSGHTSAAFSIATFFALFKSGKNWNFVFAFFALIVAYGRIYMSQHFMTDIYVGMLVGVVVTTLIYCYYPKKLEPVYAG